MKTLMCALLGLTPNLLAWNYAVAQTASAADGTPRVIVVRPNGDAGAQPENFEWVSDDGQQHIQIIAQAVAGDGSAQDGEVKVIQLVGGPNGANGNGVTADVDVQVTSDGGHGQAKQIKVVARPKTDDPDAAQRGWLGVSIMSVPEAVAAQAGTPGRGVMVGNVMTGSPADKAGIQNNDVIVSINGEEVAGDVGPAVDLIKTHKPGETINVGILREGKPSTMKVTLGSRADMKNFEWKFEGLPAQVDEQVKTRGKFILKNPNGELIVKDLGELNDLKNLPDNIRMFVPQSGSRSTQVFVENGQKTIKMNVEKDGSTVSIEQADGGPITVRRSENGGQETVATYDNADALKAADEDAYGLYSQAGQNIFVHVDGDDDDDDGPHVFFHGGDPSGQWRVHLEQSLAEAKTAYGEAMQELHNNLMELNKNGTLDVEKLHELLNSQGGKGLGTAFTFTTGKPTHRFEVNADGSIEVSIRKGDSEVTQSFKSEADMSKRRPDLYEKYQDVKAADEE